MTRSSEEGSKITGLQDRLSGADFKLLTPTRRLIMEGELMLKISGKVRGSKKLNYFILFNDLLVMARPRKITKKEQRDLIYRNAFPLGVGAHRRADWLPMLLDSRFYLWTHVLHLS
jgi:hypothetical protein